MALTFNDFKQKISIIDVAVYLGYKFDRTKGLNQPSFVLTDGKNNVLDRIYIKNPKDNAKQGYWRRGLSASGSQKGDLIGFIRENIDRFPEASGARNDIDAINKVLLSFSNSPATTEEIMKQYAAVNSIYTAKPFDINRYDREKHNIDYMMKFFDKRSISRDTVETFSSHIEIIKDKESKYNYRNIGFPYTIAGSDKVVGFEVRGLSNFKGKAEGSDSMKGAWIADFCANKNDARKLYFGESAYDLMAFYQLNKGKINLENSVFISTGGSFSDWQLKTITEHYNTAKPVLCFDNDINGKMYDIKAFCLLSQKELQSSIKDDKINFTVNEKSFEIDGEKLTLPAFLASAGMRNDNLLEVWKAPGKHKDWNDVISSIPKEIPNRYDYLTKQNTNNFKR